MTEKYIYADVEKPFHFWVREGKRWILRDAGADLQKSGQRPGSHPGNHGPAPGQGPAT
ncbi:MAG TPA: hypothetical protein VFE23_19175 [Usitatibacter sp.]|jgi:hypothetical protein|nr:hypothetical protein [Usitatibacter sp.]